MLPISLMGLANRSPWAFEEQAVRRAEDRPLVPEFFVGQVGVHATAA